VPGESSRTAIKTMELLVLAAVLGVGISAVSLWGWQRAREEARATRCRTILASYGWAFGAYAADSDGVLPFENVGREQEGYVAWFNVLEPYMPDKGRMCPSVARTARHYQEGYRMNSQLARSGGLPSERYRRLDTIAQPEATVVLFDAEYGGRKLSLKGQLRDVKYRHNGSANLLFADWHVERFEKDALREASNWLPPKIIWNPDPDGLVQTP
jgi:prepilin-type processing-associated H-X9-DG protein